MQQQEPSEKRCLALRAGLSLLFIQLICFAAWSQAPQVRVSGKWYRQNYILQNPVLSPDNSKIALTIQPQGNETTSGNIYKGSSGQFAATRDTLGRFKDPLIIIINPADGKYTLADFGWSPSFSPEGKRMVYTHQQKPLEGKKYDVTGLSGNDIRMLDLLNGKYETVAIPARRFFLDPVFTDSIHIVYKTGDAVNGSFGGGIAFNLLNLSTKMSTTLQPAKITYRFYDIMGDLYHLKNGFAYTVYSPQDSGKGMANEYSHLLLAGRDTVQNFGIRPFTNLKYKFANTPQGILYLDDNHLLADDTNFIATYRLGKLVRKTPLLFSYTKSYISPDGRYLLYCTDSLGTYITGTGTIIPVATGLPAMPVHAVYWSIDGMHLLIVQDHPDLKGTDILYMLSIGP